MYDLDEKNRLNDLYKDWLDGLTMPCACSTYSKISFHRLAKRFTPNYRHCSEAFSLFKV